MSPDLVKRKAVFTFGMRLTNFANVNTTYSLTMLMISIFSQQGREYSSLL